MDETAPVIVILGASGVIGESIAADLMRASFSIVAIARRFTPAQKAQFAESSLECPIVAFSADALTEILSQQRAGIIVNCLGVLQDTTRGRTDDVHQGFVSRLVTAMRALPGPALLIHVSIPGSADEDRTPFSRSKREAERMIAAAAIPSIILRPGFVIAPTAYGGGAMVRALAALPLDLPEFDASRPFGVIDIADIGATILVAASRWRNGERNWNCAWELMERNPSTVGGVIAAYRRRFGGAPPVARLPAWLMTTGAKLGDLSSHLGWEPPIRSAALREMRRGVTGDARAWIAATGIEPAPIDQALARLPTNVQEKWFARLYLAKAAIIGVLVLFWVASGLIALTVAFDAASAILESHGFSRPLAQAATVASSLVDIGVGVLIAFRRSCRAGLLAGIAVSFSYMFGAAIIAPDLWIEPLGALVKTGPAIVLMLVALAILEAR